MVGTSNQSVPKMAIDLMFSMMFSPDVAKKGRVLVVNSSMHIHYLSMLGIYHV